MAEIERSTPRGADSWMPAPEIPDNAEIGAEGATATFTLRSGGDSIAVAVSAWTGVSSVEVECHGTWAAMSGAGLVSPDWLVEDRRSWCVAFSDGQPRVVLGGRGRPKGRYISVQRWNNGELYVSWRVTVAQSDSYCARLRQLWQTRAKGREESAESATQSGPWPASVAHSYIQDKLGDALTWWKERVGETGCRLTNDSQHRIDLAIEALRRAVADGNVEEQLRARRFDGQRIGNVVCWPGRGSVAAVDPAALH